MSHVRRHWCRKTNRKLFWKVPRPSLKGNFNYTSEKICAEQFGTKIFKNFQRNEFLHLRMNHSLEDLSWLFRTLSSAPTLNPWTQRGYKLDSTQRKNSIQQLNSSWLTLKKAASFWEKNPWIDLKGDAFAKIHRWYGNFCFSTV